MVPSLSRANLVDVAGAEVRFVPCSGGSKRRSASAFKEGMERRHRPDAEILRFQSVKRNHSDSPKPLPEDGATVTQIVTIEGAKWDKIKELQIMRKPA